MWSAARAVLILVVYRGSQLLSNLSTTIVVAMGVFIFSGIDWGLLCGGRGAGPLRSLALLFFVVNLAGSCTNYAQNLLKRNLCLGSNEGHGLGRTIANVLFLIAESGHLLAVIKIQLRKLSGGLQGVAAPVFRYGLSSHVQVSLPNPGEAAVLVMSDGGVAVVAAADAAAPGSAASNTMVVEFASPSQRFWLAVQVWAVFSLFWSFATIAQLAFDISRLKGNLSSRCWFILHESRAQSVVTILNAPLAGALIFSMVLILAYGGLLRVCWIWGRFWYRRSWALVFLCVMRGCVFVRPDVARAEYIGSFVNVAFFFSLSVAFFDLILLLSTSLALRILYSSYLLTLLLNSVNGYLAATSLNNPCDQSQITHSAVWFIINNRPPCSCFTRSFPSRSSSVSRLEMESPSPSSLSAAGAGFRPKRPRRPQSKSSKPNL